MYKIISVTNRRLSEDFVKRAGEIAALDIPMILREKDLSEKEYTELARKILAVTDNVILHSFISSAKTLGHKKIHLPMHLLETSDVSVFDTVGASVHSVDEAVRAQALGASYITAGHIFETDCKKGVQPRGLDFLKNVCEAVSIPVYAIGGITPENAASAIAAGAAGVCVMSAFMKTKCPAELYNSFMGRA